MDDRKRRLAEGLFSQLEAGGAGLDPGEVAPDAAHRRPRALGRPAQHHAQELFAGQAQPWLLSGPRGWSLQAEPFQRSKSSPHHRREKAALAAESVKVLHETTATGDRLLGDLVEVRGLAKGVRATPWADLLSDQRWRCIGQMSLGLRADAPEAARQPGDFSRCPLDLESVHPPCVGRAAHEGRHPVN
jgi:hypothetical protein